MTERCEALLQTGCFTAVSHALRRVSSLAFVRRLVERLETRHEPGDEELVVLDGMALTLPKTQRHGCAKFNNKTVGGGVVWAYCVEATRGLTPVRLVEMVRGAWHDTTVMRKVTVIARGPVYVMDRGFYALDLLAQWLRGHVRFVVRVREKDLVYETIREVSKPRPVDGKPLLLDMIVRLGAKRASAHPIVRLLISVLPSGEHLVLATDRFQWSAQRVLKAYRKREHVERFHRFLKEALGLAHLYSFNACGIEFLLCTALLLALLLFLAADDPTGETIAVLRRMLRRLRHDLGLGTLWRRNTVAPRTGKKKAARKKAENH